jgi:hypothetical protein
MISPAGNANLRLCRCHRAFLVSSGRSPKWTHMSLSGESTLPLTSPLFERNDVRRSKPAIPTSPGCMVIASTIFLRPYQLSKEGFVLSIIIVPSNVSLHGHGATPNIEIQRLREEKNKRRRETVSSDLRQCFRKSAVVTSANLRQSQQGHEWRFARPSVDLNKPGSF